MRAANSEGVYRASHNNPFPMATRTRYFVGLLFLCLIAFAAWKYNAQVNLQQSEKTGGRVLPSQHVAHKLVMDPATAAPAADCDLTFNKNDEQLRAYYKKQEQLRKMNPTDPYGTMLSKLVPTVQCQWLVRVGHVIDGGKWTCAPWLGKYKTDCLVYSLGVGGDSSFEKDLLSWLPNCHLFAFDSNAKYKSLFDFDKKRVTFIGKLITDAAQSTKDKVSLPEMMKQNNHTDMTILKMDIESSEFTVLPQILAMVRRNELKICQILIEVHKNQDKTFYNLQKDIADTGFELFHSEVNYLNTIKLIEFSYIHRNCLAQFCVKEPTHSNF